MSAAEFIDQLLRERRSIRGFLDKPATPELLVRIFETAQLAPSNCNVQPWQVQVVSGSAADRMREALLVPARLRAPLEPDFPITMTYEGGYRERQIGAAKALFAATNVARDDVGARTRSYLRNFSFFDAPHAAFLFMPSWGGPREAADCGMYAQSLMLTLTAHGLASCAQGALGHYAPIVREQLGVPDDMRLLFGIAFGYPDSDHEANNARTKRAELDDAVVFHG